MLRGLRFIGIELTAYSRSPKVGNPIVSILKSNLKGTPAQTVFNPGVYCNYYRDEDQSFRVSV